MNTGTSDVSLFPTPPTSEEATATFEDWREAHDDFRTTIDGVRYVCKLTTRGTCLIPVKEDN
jgi:hypothetical protein